jgi:putative glutamine amidotransferase
VSAERVTIGVTASIEEMRSGEWTDLTVGTPATYARAIQRAGGRALILVPDERDAEDPSAVLDMVDGLIVSGAAPDLDPRHYVAERHPQTKVGHQVRDRFELALLRAAVDRGVPVLGVCRGMQVLNVVCGGTLVQHLPDVIDNDHHTGPPGQFADHEVRLEPGSLAARAAGGEHESVRSYHHQGIDAIGEGLVASGWSTFDGIVEAIERPGDGFLLGVLWHPEEDEASGIVTALVRAAEAARQPSGPR